MDTDSLALSPYQLGGALKFNHPTYVTRDADREIYEALKRGDFCYVLNSRQTGKSSLKVQTLHRLRSEKIACADIDLTNCIEEETSAEQFYRDLIAELIGSLTDSGIELEINRRTWWKEHDDLSPVHRLGVFIQQVLLKQIPQSLVIFVDEIDYVLSLEFRSGFFALIRSFYNSRSTQSDYKRLTFALLGVATPSELIRDEKHTPFNIGKAIELKGFQSHEVAPLREGLKGIIKQPHSIMEEILFWTGGQPYLTQKLCNLVIFAGKETPSISQLVQHYIIDNWEAQDEQQHLKTIKNRLFRNEQKVSNLLELYRYILQQRVIEAGQSSEESDLRLSGLVVKRDGKLMVYNPIYERVFNESWIDGELAKLRPYAENFRAWIASRRTDKSRLLRGEALEEAEQWAEKKNLSSEDREFLAASRTQLREEEIAEKEREAELEREKKAREAAEQAEQMQAEANRQAKRRISIGSIVLGLTLSSAIACVVWGFLEGQKATQARKEAENQLEIARKTETTVQQQELRLQSTDKDLKTLRQSFQSVQETRKTAETKLKELQSQLTSAQNQQRKAQAAARTAKASAQKALAESSQARAEKTLAQEELTLANRSLQQVEEALARAENEQTIINTEIQTAQNLVQLAGDLQEKGKTDESNEALRQAGLSFKLVDRNLKQALLLAATSQAYQSLEKWKEAKDSSQASLAILERVENINSSDEGLQVFVFVKNNEGDLLKKQGDNAKSKEAYQKAYYLLQNYRQAFYVFPKNSIDASPFIFLNPQIINSETLESLHWSLINLVTEQPQQQELQKEVRKSLKKHYLAELNWLLNGKKWKKADEKTRKLMLFIADREQQGWLSIKSQRKFPCDDLQAIDKSWVAHSQGHFGFSVQKKILEGLVSKIEDLTAQTLIEFYRRLGWIEEEEGSIVWGEIRYEEGLASPMGHLPSGLPTVEENVRIELLSHCKL